MMDAREIIKNIKRFGFFRMFIRFTYNLVNRLFFFQILQLVILTRKNLNESMLELPPGLFFRLIENQDLARLVGDKELRLNRKFVELLKANGDEVFGIFKRDELLSYVCFSRKSKRLFSLLNARPKQGFVYTHKSQTKSAYRGRRLHGIGVAKALVHYTEQGCEGLISFGEATKFHAARAFRRVGAVFVGKTVIFRLLGRFVVIYFGLCSQYLTITGPGVMAIDLGPFFTAAAGRLSAVFHRRRPHLAG